MTEQSRPVSRSWLASDVVEEIDEVEASSVTVDAEEQDDAPESPDVSEEQEDAPESPDVSEEQEDDDSTPDAVVEVAAPADVTPTSAQRAPAGRDLAQDASPVSGSPTPTSY